MSAVASGELLSPDCEHLSLCVGVQEGLCFAQVTGLCFGMPSLDIPVPDLEQWWDNVTSSGCEVWGLMCSGSRVCGQGYQTCLCQLRLLVWDPGWAVHTAECGHLPCPRVRNYPGTALCGPQHLSLQSLLLAARSK